MRKTLGREQTAALKPLYDDDASSLFVRRRRARAFQLYPCKDGGMDYMSCKRNLVNPEKYLYSRYSGR